ncbi:MAG: hypothetical protein KF799_11565 [Bdellovibrionales bacterium]|nr:hypothetical protein [Bdellovibrionales bacterium]
MKWLVTAFEPFGGAQSNSSQIVLKALQTMDWQGHVEFFPSVPVQFTTAWTVVKGVRARLADVQGVLALGQAERRTRLSLERVAVNWVDAAMADNSGFKPAQGRIDRGADGLFTTIPWERLEDSPLWERSYTAGTFVCNTLMYQMLKDGALEAAGFVHIPLLESQADPLFAGAARMADEQAISAMERILKFLVDLKK